MRKNNKKESKQNNRNRTANRHYRSSARNLLKLLKIKDKNLKLPLDADKKESYALALLERVIPCAFDKAVQRGAIHKNAAARKKSQAQLIYNKFISVS